MRIGLIGSSGHVGYAFDSIRNGADATVVGLAPGSVGEDMASVAATCVELGGNPRLFDNVEAMLESCRLDGVVVASYFCDHARLACSVIERGIPCFLEKPVALTLAELDNLRAVQARKRTILMPMLGLRYAPAMFTAWRALRSGAVGDIRLITAQKSYRLGTRPGFYRHRDLYGGTIPWVGSHAMDWMLWFSGKKPRSVHASQSRLFNKGNGDLEVSALCHFTLEDEVMAGISLDYLRPSKAPTHEDDRIRIAGSDGVLEVRAGNAILISDAAGGEVTLPLADPGRIFDDFMASIRGAGDPLCNHEDGFRATQACLLARQSADEGRTIMF